MVRQIDPQKRVITLGRWLTLVYGVLCYLIFVVAALLAMGFFGDLIIPKTIDTGPRVSSGQAFFVDGILLGLFALQHSLMARPFFKRWWTSIIPQSIERSTYVLFASLLLLLLYWQWLPISDVIWDTENTVGGILLGSMYFAGWLIVFLSTFLINHFDLFGLRQIYLNWRGREYTSLVMKTPLLYNLVRHPLMLGFLIVFWATPRMTLGHLFFSLATTAYILVGIYLEEKDLVASYGEAYRRYQKRVAMLLPVPKKPVNPEEKDKQLLDNSQ